MSATVVRELFVLLGVQIDEGSFKAAEARIQSLVGDLNKFAEELNKAFEKIDFAALSKAIDLVSREEREAALKASQEAREAQKAKADAAKAAAKEQADAAKAAAKAETEASRAAEKEKKEAAKAAEKAQKDAAKAVAQAEKEAAEQVEKAREQEAKSVRDLIELGRRLVLTYGAAKLGGLIRDAATAGDRFAKMGRQIGVSAEEMQEIGYAANRSGADLEQVRAALAKTNLAAFQASKGNQEAADKFRTLGVSVKNADGSLKGSTQLLEEIADKIAQVEDPTKRTALAMRIFEEEGSKLIPFLEGGGQGLRDLRARARELGHVIDNETAAASEGLVDSLTDLNLSSQGVFQRLGAALIPTMKRLADSTTNALIRNRALIDRGINALAKAVDFGARKFIQYSDLFELVATNAGVVKTALTGLGVLAGGFLLAKLGAATMALWAMVTGFNAAGAAALLAQAKALLLPIVVGAAIAALVLIIDDFITAVQGGKSVIGELIEEFLERPNPDNNPWIEIMRFIAAGLDTAVVSARNFIGLFSDENATADEARRYWQHFWDPIFDYWAKMAEDIPILRELIALARFTHGGGAGDLLARGVNAVGAAVGPSDEEQTRLSAGAARARAEMALRNGAAGVAYGPADPRFGGALLDRFVTPQPAGPMVLTRNPSVTVQVTNTSGDVAGVADAAQRGAEKALRDAMRQADRELGGY